MKPGQLLSKKVNSYLPHIFLIGLSIGTANYLIHGTFNWFQWIILALSTSFVIGYSLLSIAANKSSFQAYFQSKWKLYVSLVGLCLFIGVFASELENMLKGLIFLNDGYQPFSAGSNYAINAVISLAMGLSFFFNEHLFPISSPKADEIQSEPKEQAKLNDPLAQIPLRQGENIRLLAVEDIAYFEAFDNYSFAYDLEGNRMLCDYSLLFLEKRLGNAFMRIHRKFILNTTHIKQIKPQLNSRYLIEFNNPQLEAISSSKSYAASIRSLIKIE